MSRRQQRLHVEYDPQTGNTAGAEALLAAAIVELHNVLIGAERRPIDEGLVTVAISNVRAGLEALQVRRRFCQ